jgi:hypothetical protein
MQYPYCVVCDKATAISCLIFSESAPTLKAALLDFSKAR